MIVFYFSLLAINNQSRLSGSIMLCVDQWHSLLFQIEIIKLVACGTMVVMDEYLQCASMLYLFGMSYSSFF